LTDVDFSIGNKRTPR